MVSKASDDLPLPDSPVITTSSFRGILTLMFTPYSLHELGVQLGDITVSLIYTAIMAPLIVIMNFFAARKPESLQTYPQMRITTWTKKRFLINALGWGAYLFAYEFLFRGILLSSITFDCKSDTFFFFSTSKVSPPLEYEVSIRIYLCLYANLVVLSCKGVSSFLV